MTDESIERQLLKAQLELVALRERLDRMDAENERRDERMGQLADGFAAINNTLKQIKYIGIGVLAGLALALGERVTGVLKLLLAAL